MSFEDTFERAPEAAADAPGRVNLIGEHTDYNGGFVLPMAIPQRTRVEVARRDDREVEVATESVDPPRARFTLGRERRSGAWVDYAQGVTWALAEEGHAVPGFSARLTSNVPVGAGLSSSAALLVALTRALRALASLPLDDEAVARVAHRAEHDFVGAPVGVMDTLASSLADDRNALFIDTRAMRCERVPVPPEGEFMVVDSGVAHRNAQGDYRTRRAECERAAAALGVASLRDLPAAWEAPVARLVPPLDRRVRHVVTENARVLEAVAAMRAGDLARLGELMDASHRSMRDDYEVSVPEVDRLVESARAQPEVYGARLTGGGFGGAIVALVRAGGAARAAEGVLRDAARDGRGGVRVLVPEGLS